MKANELMLDDWVYGLYPNGIRYTNPFRISAVDIYPLNRSPRIVTRGGYGFHEEDLEPIPLTPEILEKNGFYKDWDGKTYLMGELFRLTPLTDGMGYCLNKCVSMQIYSVHTLQHVLRLCGLNELANNFKL